MNCYDAAASLLDGALNPSPVFRLSHLQPASNDQGLRSVILATLSATVPPIMGVPALPIKNEEPALFHLARDGSPSLTALARQEQAVGGILAHLFPAVANLVQVVVESRHVLVRQLEGAEHPNRSRRRGCGSGTG